MFFKRYLQWKWLERWVCFPWQIATLCVCLMLVLVPGSEDLCFPAISQFVIVLRFPASSQELFVFSCKKSQPQEHCSKYCFQNPEFWWDKQILMWTIYYNALWKWFVWLSDPVSGTFIHKYWWNSCYRFTGLDVTNFAFKIVSWCSCSFWWPWPLCKVTVGQHKRKFSVELSQHLRK